MKTEIIKVKYAKPIHGKLQKIHLQVITDVCINNCSWNVFWKKPKEYVFETLRNISIVRVNCW